MAKFPLKLKIDYNTGIVSYQEEVINDLYLLAELKGKIARTKAGNEKAQLQKQYEREKNRKRIIPHEFPIANIKDSCVDCLRPFGTDFETRVLDYIIRGNYCPICNGRYG